MTSPPSGSNVRRSLFLLRVCPRPALLSQAKVYHAPSPKKRGKIHLNCGDLGPKSWENEQKKAAGASFWGKEAGGLAGWQAGRRGALLQKGKAPRRQRGAGPLTKGLPACRRRRPAPGKGARRRAGKAFEAGGCGRGVSPLGGLRGRQAGHAARRAGGQTWNKTRAGPEPPQATGRCPPSAARRERPAQGRGPAH